ncbi:MAG TPA: hypothetical protein VM598_00465, partial [Bdellovibrionota bacterium]|nr:hypothetical protein [Bdellovibrionota bacterium]
LGSPFCRLREVNEASQPGDVVAVRSRSGEEIHGMIYVTDQLYYSKNGEISYGHPFALQAAHHVLDLPEYFTTPSCRRPKDAEAKAVCARRIDVYDCTSVEGYLRQRPTRFTEEYLGTDRRVSALEEQMSSFVVSGKRARKSRARDFDALKPQFTAALREVESRLAARSPGPIEERFLWSALRERLRSSLDQFPSLVIPH